MNQSLLLPTFCPSDDCQSISRAPSVHLNNSRETGTLQWDSIHQTPAHLSSNRGNSMTQVELKQLGDDSIFPTSSLSIKNFESESKYVSGMVSSSSEQNGRVPPAKNGREDHDTMRKQQARTLRSYAPARAICTEKTEVASTQAQATTSSQPATEYHGTLSRTPVSVRSPACLGTEGIALDERDGNSGASLSNKSSSKCSDTSDGSEVLEGAQPLPRNSSVSACSLPDYATPPVWVTAVLENAKRYSSSNSSVGIARPFRDCGTNMGEIMAALDHIQRGRVSPAVVCATGGISEILRFLKQDARAFATNGADISLEIAAVAALYVLSSNSACLEAMLRQGILETLCRLLRDSSVSSSKLLDHTVHRAGDSDENDDPHDNSCATGTETHTGPHSSGVTRDNESSPLGTCLPRSLWAAVIGTIAKLIVCSTDACACAVRIGALPMLAAAARPNEHIAIRSHAAAGLAAVAVWSGPRFAVDIINTPNVIEAMTAVLADEDPCITAHLRRATLDGFTAIARRRHARLLLTERGCDEIIGAAARNASSSGDYDIAALSTLAAGQLAGHGVDEFGFLVSFESDPCNSSLAQVNCGRKPHNPVGDDVSSLQGPTVTSVGILQLEMINERGFVLADLMERVESHVDLVVESTISNVQPCQSLQHSFGKPALPGVEKGAFFGTVDSGLAKPMPNAIEMQENDATSSALVAFTSVAKQAAERNPANQTLQRTVSRMATDARNEQKWQEVLDTTPGDLERENGKQGRVHAYPILAKIPIPNRLRPKIWPILLDIESLRTKKPKLYKILSEKAAVESLPDDIEHTISADVTRTMPLHCLFWSGGAQVGVESLRSVLRCYAFYVPEVGYCQGMSSIAALLIMNAVDEEDAFLMLVRFMSRYGYNRMFLPGFPQYKDWLEELRPVISSLLPSLSARLEKESIPVELYADKWLITALTHSFPHRHLLRIWDVMLLSGSPKIILKSCIAVLLLSESHLWTLDFEGIMSYLQRGFAETESGILNQLDPEAFLNIARNVKLDVSSTDVAGTKNTNATASENPHSNHSPETPKRSRKPFSACFSCFKSKTD